MNSPLHDWLTRWGREQLTRMQDDEGRFSLRAWVNHNQCLCGVLAIIGVLMLLITLWPSGKTTRPSLVGRQAWFYDLNTASLFTASRKESGPIDVPSGPGPDGEPAGYRAYVYSYAVEPQEEDLFVGFIERPDPTPGAQRPTHNMDDFDVWCRGRQIRRLEDTEWVAADSTEGQAILDALSQPNDKSQTAIYQVPH